MKNKFFGTMDALALNCTDFVVLENVFNLGPTPFYKIFFLEIEFVWFGSLSPVFDSSK